MNADVIRGPVGMLIGLVVWLVVTPLLLGAINGWYLQAVDAGEVRGERVDRVVLKAAGDTNANTRWGKATSAAAPFTSDSATYDISATTAYKLVKDGDNCKVGASSTTEANTVPAATWYTPLGSEVTSAAVVAGTDDDSAIIAGCKWAPAGSVFNAGGLSGLIEIILQAAGLAPPIAVLIALGHFGQSFMRQMGGHPILAAVITVIVMLLVATLVNSLIPFLTTAFTAVDSTRYVMYSEGLGNVSVIIKRFYGVVLVSGLIIIAWSVIGPIRGKNALASGQRM